MSKVVELAGEAKAINEYIVVCRDSWETYYKSMSTDEVDETALGYYRTSVDQLEEHGYTVEENGGLWISSLRMERLPPTTLLSW